MKNAFIRPLAALTVALCLSAAAAPAADPTPPRIVVAIPPLAGIVERIAGPLLRAETLLSASQDPHTFEPTPAQIARLTTAIAYFQIGLPFESRLLERLRDLPRAPRVFDAAAGIRRLPAPDHADPADHDHAAERHAAGAPDPHLWMAPAPLRILAANVAAQLAALDPPRAEIYRANARALQAEIEALDRRLAAALEPFRGRAFYVFHPAFGYFAAAYGLRQVPIETAGRAPTPRRLAALTKQARADGARVVLVQPQFDRRSAEIVAAAIGAEVLPIDPMAHDMAAQLELLGRRLVETFSAPVPAP